MDRKEALVLGVDLFARPSKTKEEAFLQGVLFGYGAHNPCPVPNWDLLRKDINNIDIAQEMRNIFEVVHKRDIAEAEQLLELEKAKNDNKT